LIVNTYTHTHTHTHTHIYIYVYILFKVLDINQEQGSPCEWNIFIEGLAHQQEEENISYSVIR